MSMQSSRIFARYADSMFVAINVLRDSQIANRAQFFAQKKAEEFTAADLQLALQHGDAQSLGQVLRYGASTLTGTPPGAIEVMVKDLDYDTERENVKQRYKRGERLEFHEPMLELFELYQVKASAARKQDISSHSIGNAYLNAPVPLAKASGLGEPAYISDALLDITSKTILWTLHSLRCNRSARSSWHSRWCRYISKPQVKSRKGKLSSSHQVH
jgi:hypothetical protein